MKPAQKSAISYVIHNEDLKKYFHHDGLRTVLCSYAMQASTHRWLGYTSIGSMHCLVDEVTAHSEDLNWTDINDYKDVIEVVQYLGKTTGSTTKTFVSLQSLCSIVAKIHCVADSDCINSAKDKARLPLSSIPRETEKTIRDAIRGRDEEFIEEMVEFGRGESSVDLKPFVESRFSPRSTERWFVEIINSSSISFVTNIFLDYNKKI